MRSPSPVRLREDPGFAFYLATVAALYVLALVLM